MTANCGNLRGNASQCGWHLNAFGRIPLVLSSGAGIWGYADIGIHPITVMYDYTIFHPRSHSTHHWIAPSKCAGLHLSPTPSGKRTGTAVALSSWRRAISLATTPWLSLATSHLSLGSSAGRKKKGGKKKGVQATNGV